MPVVVPIARDGPVAVPMDYTVPTGTEIVPLAVRATFDGSGAGAAFVPTLEFVSPAGLVVAECPVVPSVAAGGSATVTWFPGVTGQISASRIALVGARLVSTVQQSIPNGVNTDLHYQSVVFDTGGFVNLGANDRILTAPAAGIYLLIAEVGWPYESGSSGERVIGIYKNGYGSGGATQISGDARMPVWAPIGGGAGGSPHTTGLTMTLESAVAGDFFSTAVAQTSGAAQNVTDQSNTLFSAILLGGL